MKKTAVIGIAAIALCIAVFVYFNMNKKGDEDRPNSPTIHGTKLQGGVR